MEWLADNPSHTNHEVTYELELPSFFVTSDQIEWSRRVEIQAAIQKHVDHAISSTINLPKDVPTDVVADLYLKGWKLGLKGITVYVDGSRSGVLLSTNEGTAEFPQNGAPGRPKELLCDIHHTTIKGEKWIILLGLYDDKPYEVLGGLSNLIEIPKKYIKGTLTKHHFKTKNNSYDLKFGEECDEMNELCVPEDCSTPDADGDGYACAWNPAPFRAAVQN